MCMVYEQLSNCLHTLRIFNVGICITSGEVQCPLKSVTIQCSPQLACICDEARAVDDFAEIMLNVSVVFFQEKETKIYVSLLCTRIKVSNMYKVR